MCAPCKLQTPPIWEEKRSIACFRLSVEVESAIAVVSAHGLYEKENKCLSEHPL
jgi:hypothetical protein